MNAPRSKRAEINGWVVLDKPVGVTSTHAVARLKRVFNAKKAGHAGTLDPLASGVLPVAFGEATKTVPFVQDGEKAYRFTIQWGIEAKLPYVDTIPSLPGGVTEDDPESLPFVTSMVSYQHPDHDTETWPPENRS